MVDNFERIWPHLTFDDDDTFYRVMIIKRRKENPEMEKGNKTLDYIYLYKEEDLEKCRDKIINHCMRENARAYIDLEPRSIKKVAMKSMVLMSQLIFNEEYKSAKNIYNKAFGNTPVKKKYFMIDYDNNDKYTLEEVLEYVKNHKNNIFVDVFPTLNGGHIITKPFDSREMKMKFVNVGVQKEALAVLYYHL